MTLVIDTSALVAIAFEEAESDAFIEVLETADEAVMSPMNYVELGMVLIGRDQFPTRDDLDEWLGIYRIEIARAPVVDASALDAYVRYGNGRHPARLNLADCFSYALAKTLDAPLLYKGNDFARTDIRSALD